MTEFLPTTWCAFDDGYIRDHELCVRIEVTLESRARPHSYAVRYMSLCLNVDGKWDHEPIPSSQTDRWLSKHRFASFDEAKQHAMTAIQRMKKLA